MDLAGMLTMYEFYIDDVADDTSVVVQLLNSGKNRMASAVKATFPDVAENADMDDEFVFPAKYHDLPVLYAAAMYKANDSSISEKDSFMGQFLDGIADFTENYSPPMQYRDEQFIQHFTATEGTTDFSITKETFNPSYNNVKVYKNSDPQYNGEQFYVDGRTITFYNGLVEGDVVSAVWEEHAAFQQPPYGWWTW